MVTAFEIREIVEDDLPKVVALLCEGFPGRKPEYWRTGLRKIGTRERPEETEKYGFVLAADNELRGVVLTIPSIHLDGSGPRVFINISSWYVQPPFRGSPARELYRRACRREDVTYTNLSPALHTIKTIRSFGFEEWTAGQMIAVGLKWDRSSLQKNRIVSWSGIGSVEICPSDKKLLADHESLGCLTLCIDTPNGASPFIFVRRRVKGFIPCAQLIYCRDSSDLVGHGLAISSWLMMRGFPLMLVDTSASIEGLLGLYMGSRGSKYFKGHRPIKAIDHTYSEMVFFGF